MINGRKVIYFFIAFFGVVFAVNGIMVTLALQQPSHILAKNGYVASIDFAKMEKKIVK